ncbi:hypothetical protein PR048_023674 [Dryococelus australis]|uniref:Maturase K n=1 Tax=Dryococelus australis TaxID=614101 RepID=A0ABQ9GUS1_9NEOP|nr:hypothetical protein PR048_023674 [Dryococelus australis]
MKLNLDISDKRGTHHNRPCAVSFDVKELVRDHIRSMPAQESHYSSSTSSKLYLISELFVERMYDLFKERHPKIKFLHSLYSDIFRSEFKLRFGPPRSDSCSYCIELYIHLVAAESKDEQKRISAQSILHHRKAETAYKNESVAKLGSSEVTSCILKYIELHFEPLKVDRDFTLIERRKKKSTVYHPKQWLEVIVNASLVINAYYMDKEDFIDMSAIEVMFKKQPDFKITSFHWIQFSSEKPNTVRMPVSHNILQPWHSYVIRPLPRGRKHLYPLPTILPLLYKEVIAVKKAKKLARHVQVSSCSIS